MALALLNNRVGWKCHEMTKKLLFWPNLRLESSIVVQPPRLITLQFILKPADSQYLRAFYFFSLANYGNAQLRQPTFKVGANTCQNNLCWQIEEDAGMRAKPLNQQEAIRKQ